MAYRFTILAAVVVALAAVVGMTTLVIQQQRAMRDMSASLQSLAAAQVDASSAGTTAGNFEWGEIKLGIKGLPDEPADESYNFTLVGKALGGDEIRLSQPIDAKGVALFGPVHVGEYKASFQHDSPYPWERPIHRIVSVTLLPQRSVEATWQFPPLEPATPVRIAVDWPEDLADAGLVLALTLNNTFTDPWREWLISGNLHVLVGPKGMRIVEHLEDVSRRDSHRGGGYSPAAIREFAHPREPLTDWAPTLQLPPHRRFRVGSHQSGVLPPDADAGDQVRGMAPIFEEDMVIGETGDPGAGEQTWTVKLPESSLQIVRDALRLRQGHTLIDVPWPEALADQPIGIVGTLKAETDPNPRGPDVPATGGGAVVTAEFLLLLTPGGAVRLDDETDVAVAFEEALADAPGELKLPIEPDTTSLSFRVEQVLARGPAGVVTENSAGGGYGTSANLGRFARDIPTEIAGSMNRILEQARAGGDE